MFYIEVTSMSWLENIMLWKENNWSLSVGVWESLDSQKFIDQILGIEKEHSKWMYEWNYI